MDEFNLYKFIEFIIFALYLTFIYLAIQIWLLWKDVNKDDFKINTIINESFFKKNCIYVFSFSIFFMGRQIFEGVSIDYARIYFILLEMLGFICIVLFAYDWYSVLRLSVNKKLHPHELPEFMR
ncbi:MAG: hypothetical protein KKG76_02470 [Euryarchaeota archaeon]|nr:hypothetical protein [Euryarchaeota archaeon]